MKRKLLSLLVLLMTAATGAWADNPIVWNASDLDGTGTVTKDGVTLTPSNGDARIDNCFYDFGDNTFSTTLGNFTKIEIVYADYPEELGGWSLEILETYYPDPEDPDDERYIIKQTWTGNANSVTINAAVYNIQSITFTIEEAAGGDPEPTCGDGVTWSLDNGELTISSTGSGTGVMTTYHGDDMPWYSEVGSITSVVIESGVTTIGDCSFYGCSYLSTVTIPATVTSIGECAFYNCTSLTTVTIPASVTTIGYEAFCSTGLTSINIPASVTYIGSEAFYQCSNLATVTLNSNPNIRLRAFDDLASGATVTMNLTANEGETGEYWMTFFNNQYNFQADANTQVFKVALSGTDLTLNEVTDGIVTKNTPVVLKTTATGGNLVMTLTTTASSDTQDNSLTGVSDQAGVTAAYPSKTYVLNKKSSGVGFYKLTSGNTIGYGKAYLTYSGAGAPEFFSFDESTGIDATLVNSEKVNGVVYDLQGRRVSQPTKGLYIVNGKKVFINK